MTRQELEDRLIEFAVLINEISYSFNKSRRSLYYSDQMIRSSSSAALNYGEVMGAESNKDFIHKNRIIIKELRETFITLRIINRLGLSNQQDLIEKALRENNELISIFVKTVKTSLNKQIHRSNI